MIISEIQNKIEEAVKTRDCFIVEIKISKSNEIEITIESESSIVKLDDCVYINRAFEAIYDREVEDYSLTVTSAGLDQGFKVLKQYIKAIGSKVEVALKGGTKMVATLVEATEDEIKLNYTLKEAVEGKKKKEFVEHNDIFQMSEINSVRPFIEIK